MVTFVYAFRDRDVLRVKITLDSLANQLETDFSVVFVDYGSRDEVAATVKNLVESYAFAYYFYVPAQLLLWNKSKALNFGIKQAKTPYIFIADVDLVFHPRVTALLKDIADPQKAYLFKLGYMRQRDSEMLKAPYQFEALLPSHSGLVNGMVFTSKMALQDVEGFDTFYHFYGAEDEDLYARLANSGIAVCRRDENYFLHNWHVVYGDGQPKKITGSPRLHNIKRINQRHYLSAVESSSIRPPRLSDFGNVVKREDQDALSYPTVKIGLKNIDAHIIHFFNEQVHSFKNEIVEVTISEDPYYRSWKHRVKKLTGKQSQPYLSMEKVSGIVLSAIVFQFRDVNYAYVVKDLKTIIFTVKL